MTGTIINMIGPYDGPHTKNLFTAKILLLSGETIAWHQPNEPLPFKVGNIVSGLIMDSEYPDYKQSKLRCMDMTGEFTHIRDWAREKGIYEKGDIHVQIVKVMEELGELAKAVIKNDYEEFVDALGDTVVTLVNTAELGNIYFPNNPGITLEEAVNSAFSVIKNRTGKMEDGTFKKD